MSNKFISFMEKVGADIRVVWTDVVKYLPTGAALAALIFPGQAGTIAGVVSSVELIKQAVATVEQKFAAAGQAKAGPQKLAQVLAIVSPTVTDLLAKEGLSLNQAQIANIVNAVVAVLNVPTLAA